MRRLVHVKLRRLTSRNNLEHRLIHSAPANFRREQIGFEVKLDVGFEKMKRGNNCGIG